MGLGRRIGEVTQNMTVAREEIFGRVVLMRFSSEEDAVANGTVYGLTGAVWRRDFSRAHRVAGAVQAGQVYINDYMPIGVEARFGGYKMSGYSREKALEAVREYT